MQVYLVGGAVRDRLLGLPVRERDWVVVGASPRELLERGYKPVGKDFPVFLHPDSGEEYALARTERKTGPGYKGFSFHASPEVSLEEDLRRRDLTINAMAEAADGTLIDPYHGQQDLQQGLLRHVSPAFAEDPVRILRVARFAACFGKWGFKVAHGTNALMRRMVDAGEVDHLVPERVWAELVRALASDSPQRFFTVLAGCGALSVLFPEVERAAPPTPGAHQRFAANPALQALQRCSAHDTDTRVRFAALMMALAPEQSQARRLTMVEDLCKRYRAPNDYRWLARHAIRHQGQAQSDDPQLWLEMMEAAGAFRETRRWHALLRLYQASGQIDAAAAERLERARAHAAAIGAADVADPALSGPQLGAAIHAQRLAAIGATLDDSN
jgi:tRNA nucleotidyltransferase (CCA-adding enzyme)